MIEISPGLQNHKGWNQETWGNRLYGEFRNAIA